jgi:hypothetical protein
MVEVAHTRVMYTHKQRNLDHFDTTCLGSTHAPLLELGNSSSNSTPIFKKLKTLNIKN